VRVISMGPSSALGQAACAHQVCSRCSWTAVSRLNRSQNSAAHDAGPRASAARRRKALQGAQGGAACAASFAAARHASAGAATWGTRGRRWAAPITIQVSNRSESCDALACEGDMDSVLGCSDRSCRSRGPPVSASRTTIVLYRCTCGRARRVRRGEVHSQAPTPPRLPVASWRVRRQR
jgi:hypothetical protein